MPDATADDPQAFLDEYAHRINEGTRSGDLSAAAAMRTDDAVLVWRAPDMTPIEGRLESAGPSLPGSVSIEFSAARWDGERIIARIQAENLPVGTVSGDATVQLRDGLIDRLEIELDRPIRR